MLLRGSTLGADCAACPFAVNGGPQRPVVSEYPADPAWIIVGEGPSRTDVQLQRPFCGAQQLVEKMLAKVGRRRDQVYLTTAYLCAAPVDATPEQTAQAVRACQPRLHDELRAWPGMPVLTLGAAAAQAVLPPATLAAIDPADVPKSHKRSQKERQRAEAKALRAALKAQAKADKAAAQLAEREAKLAARAIKQRDAEIAALYKRRLAELLDHQRDVLRAQIMRAPTLPGRKRKPPSRRFLDAEIAQHYRRKLEVKADADARVAWELAQRADDLRDAYVEAHPVEPAPAKRKPKKVAFRLTDIVSTCFEVDADGSGTPRPVIPSIHPAMLLAGGGASVNGTHTPDLAFVNLYYDAMKVDALARGVDVRLKLNVLTEVEDAARAARLLQEVLDEALREGEVALDLETYVEDDERHSALQAYAAQIKTIGLATTTRAVSVMWALLPPWALSYLQLVLAHPQVTKTFHNGLYDRTVFAGCGFEVAGPWHDTLLAHHATFPGCAHRLQAVTSQFFAVSPWKCLRGDVEVVLPDRSTISIADAVRRKVPEILSYEAGRIVAKPVTGWHKVKVPGQAWVAIDTERSDRKYTRGLVVTPDHKVMTTRGLVEAQQLRPGEDRIATDEPAFSDDQVAVALGTLLGDSSLHVSRTFHATPWAATRASVRGGHANLGLRDMKVAALALGTRCTAASAHERHTRAGTLIRAATFYGYGTTWAFQYMRLAPLVYDAAWKRRIKPEALARLGQRGLAMMFMDDGDLARCGTKGKTLRAGFATHGFPLEDVELFAAWLRARYGQVSIYTARGPYTALSTAATRNMLEDLRGFIHPAVGYKTVYADPFKPVEAGTGVYHAQVTAIREVPRPVELTPHQRRLFDHRYCLSVADTKLFFTNYGLVSNSEYRNNAESAEGLTAYNAQDTGATLALRPALTVWLQRTKTEQIYALDLKMAEIASAMHLVGMPVDRARNQQLLETFTANVKQARQAIERVVEDPAIREDLFHHLARQQASTQRKHESPDPEARYQGRLDALLADKAWRWKINGSKDVAALLLALGVPLIQRTEAGLLSTKKDVLEGLVHVPVVRDLLQFRANDKLLSTFVWMIFDRYRATGERIHWGFADDEDRIHPIWSIHKITGRWASSSPVVSNVPKDKWRRVLAVPAGLVWHAAGEGKWTAVDGHGVPWQKDDKGRTMQQTRPNLRAQIVAPPGRVFVGFDFLQLEARVIALISGDPFLCQVFADGKDIHRECARAIFPTFDSMSKEEQKKAREETKPLEYGAFYGGSVETLWKQLLKEGRDVKLADVAKSVGALMARMAGVVQWQQTTIARAGHPPYEITEFLYGRRRTFPLGQVEPTEALNFGVQAAGASIMNTGMARVWDQLRTFKQAYAITQIHDAAVFECWEDDADALRADVIRCFTQEYERDGRVIPFPVEAAIGKSWAEV